jgi:2-dehydropantoate 2-reductase
VKIAIIGAGAMGCLLASYLAPHHEVWLVDGWQTQVDTINQQGLRRERDGLTTTCHPHATTDATAVEGADVALVLVKYHQTTWAAQQVVQALAPHGICVTLQNGIGGADVLAETLGDARVTRGVTSLGATLVGPGHVRHAGMGDTVFATTLAPAMIQQLSAAFTDGGLPAHASDNLDSLVWGKLVVNVGINALTGILRIPNGMVASHAGARALLTQAVNEAVAVAQALNITLPYDDPVAHVLQVATATAANRSSTLQDVLRGSPSEIATINGAVVRYAHTCGISVPINHLLCDMMDIVDTTTENRIQ